MNVMHITVRNVSKYKYVIINRLKSTFPYVYFFLITIHYYFVLDPVKNE